MVLYGHQPDEGCVTDGDGACHGTTCMHAPIWYWRQLDGSSNAGYVVTLLGETFGVPRSSLWDTLAYLARCRCRYPQGLPELECETWQRGGPWRWRLPSATCADAVLHGVTGVVQCSRKADAITTLRHKWRRTRLPAGLTWEITRG